MVIERTAPGALVRTTIAAAALFLGASLVACTGTPGSDAPTGGDSDGSSEGSTEAPMEENFDEGQLVGIWRSDEKGDPFLEFREEGRFVGSDGCNGLGGDYTVSGEAVKIERGGSTLKACPGVDDWLRSVASVTFEGDTMTVFDKNDDEIGQLHRASE